MYTVYTSNVFEGYSYGGPEEKARCLFFEAVKEKTGLRLEFPDDHSPSSGPALLGGKWVGASKRSVPVIMLVSVHTRPPL